MPGSPGLQAVGAHPAPSSVAGAEQKHKVFLPAFHRGTFYLPDQLAYGYGHPFNKNLIRSRTPHVSTGKCINENINSEQKVVINVRRTCAASLIMLPGNRGRDGRSPPGASGSLRVLFKAEVLPGGKREPHKTALPFLATPIYRHTCTHTCIHTFLWRLQNAILNK